MDMSNLRPVSINEIRKQHSKTLYRSICTPSTVQSYSLCIEYMKNWFLNKFKPDTFKSIYVDGKDIYDDARKLSRIEMLKRQKPALAIVPSIDLEFDNDKLDSYPYGMDLYTQVGKFKNSFMSIKETNSYMGIGMETLLIPFTFRIKLETKAQQLDMYKYIKLACRVGYTNGEDVDLDFHIPYQLMIQVAKDNNFATTREELPDSQGFKEYINNIPGFLRWINMHSTLPFLYRYRTLNGNNEFFLRMTKMYVHIRSLNLTADDGEREGQMTNNFGLEWTCEVRFPAPKMYAYYSDNEHHLQEIYGSWYQPGGPITTCYTFKGIEIPDKNKNCWPMYMSTTYEDSDFDPDKPDILTIDISSLLQGDIGDCIQNCINRGISPSIFFDMMIFNGGEYVTGKMNWSTFKFTSDKEVKQNSSYIGIYVDTSFLGDFIVKKSEGDTSRLHSSKEQYHEQEYNQPPAK